MEQGFAVVRPVENGWEAINYYFGPSAWFEATARMAALNVGANALEWGIFSARRMEDGTTGLWWESKVQRRPPM